jgi:hypothetical protein
LQPGQQDLTPAQQAEARRFADERIQAQLSTEPVDEQQAEAFLRQAYEAAGLAPPRRIHWLDGPLQLGAALAPLNARDGVWASIGDRIWDRVWDRVENSVRASIEDRGSDRVENSVRASIEDRGSDRVWDLVKGRVWDSVRASRSVSLTDSLWYSIWAYEDAPLLVCYHFFDVYLAPNDVHALCQFNERVSGYWPGKEHAVLVRRPKLLSLDAEGRLHSAAGKCLEYHDGWGFYAWHGVRVPKHVILAPDRLTRSDFQNEQNAEVRRAIQERMGQRFVSELGGVVIDAGPRGTLYEVALPGDPEEVARYVQVQDAPTERGYFLRVPPTIQTAAEAVAWSFELSVEDYAPAQET